AEPEQFVAVLFGPVAHNGIDFVEPQRAVRFAQEENERDNADQAQEEEEDEENHHDNDNDEEDGGFVHRGSPFCWCGSRQRRQRSAAASAHIGNRKANPVSSSRPGTTRRLFRINSVSVRKKNAPISSIHSAAGRPTRLPHARRRVRMNSSFGTGLGEARLTGPS